MSSPQDSPTQASAQTVPGQTAPVAAKTPRPLSCKLCQIRKIKCDKCDPCSNCKKHDLPCEPAKRAPVRQRRRPNQELQERLANCERLLQQFSKYGTATNLELNAAPSVGPPSSGAAIPFNSAPSLDTALSFNAPHVQNAASGPPSTFSPVSLLSPGGLTQATPMINGAAGQADWTPSGTSNASFQPLPGHGTLNNGVPMPQLSQHFTNGRLVNEDGGTRFMDSAILGTMHDELRRMRELIQIEDDADEPSPETLPDDNSELVLGVDTPSSISPEDLWPDAQHVNALWRFYLARVDPLTKVIHVPTLQPYVNQGAEGCSNIPKPYEALLFSIWLMAVVAMTPDESQQYLGYSKDEALQRFSTGVCMSLKQMHFLKSYDLTVLQALVIYLISLQGRYQRHASWILNGVVIRIAQKMGLHRDGESLNLSPFETEMRRRLWWQIIMLDAKYAMMTGLTNSALPRHWDTKEPKNINDSDMDPRAKIPFKDRDGPTEMIFVMLTNKIARFLVETPGLEIMLMLTEWSGTQVQANPQMNVFRESIARLGQELLVLLDRYCDPNAGPVHLMAIAVKAQIIQKLQQLANSGTEQSEWGAEIQDSNDRNDKNDNAFKLAICAMEHDEENCRASRDKGFLWHALLHFQLNVFVYVATQLYKRFDGILVERAWKQVEVVYEFHPELYKMSNKTNSSLANIILQAWTKRQAAVQQRTGYLIAPPQCIERLYQAYQSLRVDEVKLEQMAPQSTAPIDFGLQPSLAPGPGYDDFIDFTPFDSLDGNNTNSLNGLPMGGQQDIEYQSAMSQIYF